jgi:hypothetical protein
MALKNVYRLLPTGVFELLGPLPPGEETPRLIMSWSSSAFDDRERAKSSVMSFEKYALARP